MRLFIGVHLPNELKAHLAELQAKLRTDSALQSFNRNFDLTLKFMGDVTPEKIEEAKKRLKRFCFEKFTASLDKAGIFPDEKHPRVVWVGAEPRERFVALQQNIEEVLKGLFPVEEKFHPHLTLSRVKEIFDAKEFEKVRKLPVEPKEFVVEQVDLVESILSREGARHRVLLSVNGKV